MSVQTSLFVLIELGKIGQLLNTSSPLQRVSK